MLCDFARNQPKRPLNFSSSPGRSGVDCVERQMRIVFLERSAFAARRGPQQIAVFVVRCGNFAWNVGKTSLLLKRSSTPT